jgi:hypothetical protein
MTKHTLLGTARMPAAKSGGARYLALKDLPEKGINYHTNHLRRMWGDGRFPPPIHLSPRKLAWAESVIDAWLASKMEAA